MPYIQPHVVRQSVRVLRIARHLLEGGDVTTQWMRSTFGVGVTTAKKDLRLVCMWLPVERIPVPRGIDPHTKRVRLVRRDS